MLMQLMEILLVLNKDINFPKTHELTNFLFRGGRGNADPATSPNKSPPEARRIWWDIPQKASCKRVELANPECQEQASVPFLKNLFVVACTNPECAL